MTILCDLCEQGNATKSVIALFSQPLVALDVCVICYLQGGYRDYLRVVEEDEKVEEVIKMLEREEND